MTLPVVEECHCGHNRATHFEKKHSCLASMCECLGYAHVDGPKPAPPPPKPSSKAPIRPHLDSSCRCSACNEYDGRGKAAHPFGCLCLDCYSYGWP